MILPDYEIARLCKEQNMITPFNPDLVNPASLDVRLGETILIEQEKSRALRSYSLCNYTKDTPFLLMPGEFILAETKEMFNMPEDVAAHFALKSSCARAGFEHLLAGFIDPGFNNSVLTLEIKNARNFHPVPMWPGMRIGQIIFHRMASEPSVTYKITGRYNNDHQVSQCKGLM